MELLERSGWLIRLRWLALLVLGAGLALSWLWRPGELPLLPLGIVTLAIALYNAQFAFYAHSLRAVQAPAGSLAEAARFLQIQLILDLLALVALIHFSGGVESPLALFLVYPVLVAGMFLPPRASLVLAALATLLLAGVIGFEYAGLLTHYHPPLLPDLELYRQLPFVLAAAGLLVACLWLLGLTASSIRTSLQRREQELAQGYQAALDDCGELEAVNERLRRIDRERTRFLTLVTHELRAPIHTIHTCVELALAGHASPEKVRDILERVLQRTLELSDLISDLLRLARAREEALRDEGFALVQPGEVLDGVVKLMRTEAESKDLFLSVDIATDLARVRANPDRLKLVWTNLLSNAIKYTEPGGIVAVTLEQTPQYLVGTVRDTGIGIPPEEQERVFDEFYRADNAREMSPAGTGMGLAIVRRIIENWGGTISVESELSLGTKFTFVLPRADVERET